MLDVKPGRDRYVGLKPEVETAKWDVEPTSEDASMDEEPRVETANKLGLRIGTSRGT